MLSKRLLGVLLTALLCCGGVVGAGGGGKGRKTEKKYKKLEKIERKCDAKIRPLRELLNLPLSSVAANARLMSDNAAMAAEIEQLKGDQKALQEMMENVHAGCQAATVEPATEEPADDPSEGKDTGCECASTPCPTGLYRKSDGDACREPEATRATGDTPTRMTGLWYGLTTAEKEELKQLMKGEGCGGYSFDEVCPSCVEGDPPFWC